jgi:hypothetical protein
MFQRSVVDLDEICILCHVHSFMVNRSLRTHKVRDILGRYEPESNLSNIFQFYPPPPPVPSYIEMRLFRTWHISLFVALLVLTAVNTKINIFCDVMLCSQVGVHWRLGGTYCLHLQG